MGLTRRRISGLWVPVLLGLGGCTGRGRDTATDGGVGASTASEAADGSTGSADDANGSDSDPVEPTGAPPSTLSAARTGHPALSSVLVDVLAAEGPATYAHNRGLEVDGSTVLVVVELTSADAELPTEHVRSVEHRRGALVRAYVPFEALVPLASERAVRFVRPPISGSPANGTEGSS